MTEPPPADPAFYAALPRKRIGAGALITDRAGGVCIVRPTYKPGWEVPGGIVEDHETAPEACAREVREELGLDRPIGRLLVIEHQRAAGPKGDSIMCIYDGGVLDDPACIRLPPDELGAVAFVPRSRLADHLSAKLARRLGAALDARADGSVAELQDGERRT